MVVSFIFNDTDWIQQMVHQDHMDVNFGFSSVFADDRIIKVYMFNLEKVTPDFSQTEIKPVHSCDAALPFMQQRSAQKSNS